MGEGGLDGNWGGGGAQKIIIDRGTSTFLVFRGAPNHFVIFYKL